MKVSTVEHLLAAFYITGIDNVLIEIDNEEVPIMDGSSKEFIEVLQSIGIKELSKKRKYLKVLKRVEIKENEKREFDELINNWEVVTKDVLVKCSLLTT